MEAKEFQFVLVGPVKSRREYELQQAKIRSHAATATHQVRKRRLKQSQNVYDCPGDVVETWSSPLPLLSHLDGGLLDPFVRLPMYLSVTDRNLLHDYLTVVPRNMYHINEMAPFSSVREISLVAMAANSILVNNIILTMEHRQALLHGIKPDESVAILRRRQMIYRVLKLKLEEDVTSVSDELFFGIVATGVCETRAGNTITGQLHLDAARNIWQLRRKNGHVQVRSPVDLSICDAFIRIGVVNFFKTFNDLVAGGHNVVQRLTFMQTWNRNLRREMRHRSDYLQSASSRSNGNGLSAAYLSSRVFTFGGGALVLHGHLKRALVEERGHFEVRTWLAVLYTLNTMLYTGRHDEPSAINFLKDLTYFIESSEGTNSYDRKDTRKCKVPEAHPLAVLYMIAYAGLKLDIHLDLWRVVEFVEVIMLSGSECCRVVKLVLYSWLVADMMTVDGLVLLEEKHIHRLGSCIEAAWKVKQGLS